jgi:16S rRNA (uracil1498-N3)-methyltransferase
MRVSRVYVEQTLHSGSTIDLPEQTALHVARVLRARPGDALTLFNGDGSEFASEVEVVRGNKVSVRLGAAESRDRESPLQVTLVQSIARGDRMDFIVQKATELGVARIVPVVSQRSVVRLDAAQAASKTAHWQGVVTSSCEQCGRNQLPQLATPQRLVDYLAREEAAALRLVLEPDAPRPSLGRIDGSVEILIGPEGGFTPDETEAIRLTRFVALPLGPRILRTETAAIAALSWLQTRYGDFQI